MKMKAAIHHKYGPPEVIAIGEVDKPSPKSNELLVEVHYATVNRTDAGFRSAEYVVSRLFSGLFRPKHKVLGCEFAGIVVAKGNDVSLFQIGDLVCGFNDSAFGGHAAFLTIDASKGVVKIPNNYTLKQAAALTEGAHYALNNIVAAKVKKGDDVLVYGATGAIGSAAVQILKHIGAQITAVANTTNMELMSTLGAHKVINYEIEDFSKCQQQFSFIFDAVGKSSFKVCKPLLKNNGIYVSTELGKRGINIWLALLSPLLGNKKVIFPIPKMNKEVITKLKAIAEAGNFTPVIDSTYNLDEIVAAYNYVEKGNKTGNVILEIKDTD